jgi:hypothetical protein
MNEPRSNCRRRPLLTVPKHGRLAIFPAVDGTKGASCVFDAGEGEAGTAAPLRSMTLASSEVLECGAVWLRYRVQTG